MKNKFNKKIICLAAAAIVLTAGVSIKDAMAYFTTYVVSEGKEELKLGFTETEVQEEVIDGKKIVVSKNTGTADCYVRVRAITAEQYQAGLTDAEPNGADNWPAKNGEFYEYKKVLKAGESTTPLHIVIGALEVNPGDETPNFNVIVIQECAPVLYDADGNTYADWDGSDFNIEER